MSKGISERSVSLLEKELIKQRFELDCAREWFDSAAKDHERSREFVAKCEAVFAEAEADYSFALSVARPPMAPR